MLGPRERFADKKAPDAEQLSLWDSLRNVNLRWFRAPKKLPLLKMLCALLEINESSTSDI